MELVNYDNVSSLNKCTYKYLYINVRPSPHEIPVLLNCSEDFYLRARVKVSQ